MKAAYPGVDEAAVFPKKGIRQAQNQEQLLREEEAQKRRIALRRQQAEKLKGEARRRRIIRNSYLAILWFAVICGLSFGIAYVWPMFRKFVLD